MPLNKETKYREIPNPSDIEFRSKELGPLISTNRHRKIIDILRQPFLYKVKSYIRDRIYF